MLILLDQGTPVSIRDSLHGHIVKTAREQGWSTLLNGELLREAERAGFQVLLTTDKNLPFQQNLRLTKIAVVALGRSKWSLVQLVVEQVRQAVEAAQPGTFTLVDIPNR
jgi:hypothetical protein